MPSIVSALAASFAVIWACSPQSRAEASSERKFERRMVFVLEASEIEGLGIKSRMGDVDIAPHAEELPGWARHGGDLPSFDPATQVLVVARVHAKDRGRIEQASLAPEMDERAVRFEACWPEFNRDNGNYGVDYAVRMPRVTPIEVATAMGDVEGVGVTGSAKVETGMGDVELSGLAGSAEVKCGMGDVLVVLASGSAHRVVARSGMGDVEVVGANGGELSVGQGDLEFTPAASLSEPVSLASGMGDVRFGVPDGLDATIEAKTAMGEVGVRGAYASIEPEAGKVRTRCRVVFAGGATAVTIKTNMGDVVIEPAR
mgnify:CR=1 FL=1